MLRCCCTLVVSREAAGYMYIYRGRNFTAAVHMSTYYIYFSYLRSTIYTNKYMSNRIDLRTFCMNISSSHENMKCKRLLVPLLALLPIIQKVTAHLTYCRPAVLTRVRAVWAYIYRQSTMLRVSLRGREQTKIVHNCPYSPVFLMLGVFV